jgi:N-carbamoyl-L-amino-acid hydrolase
MAMAEIGKLGTTGVNRQAFTAEDIEARRLLASWGRALGLMPFHDAIGNLFLRFEGADASAAPVLVGSHLDSQPTGGRFDGVYGVLAGLEAVEAIRASGGRPSRPIEVVAWCNEEGGRFSPGSMGSQVFAGLNSLEKFLEVRDAEGVRLSNALDSCLRALPDIPLRSARTRPAAYLEAHIEQGPCLEQAALPVGIVTAIQGCQWLEISVSGEAAHAGTTPMSARHDALLDAVTLIGQLRACALALAPECRVTVGRLTVEPNTPNTVPSRVVFTVDFRHPDLAVFVRTADALLAACRSQPVAVEVRELLRHNPVIFADSIVSLLDQVGERMGCARMRMHSGAFHDALSLAHYCPVGMVFARCLRGVSHNPNEYASAEDLELATRVLTNAVELLAA